MVRACDDRRIHGSQKNVPIVAVNVAGEYIIKVDTQPFEARDELSEILFMCDDGAIRLQCDKMIGVTSFQLGKVLGPKRLLSDALLNELIHVRKFR